MNILIFGITGMLGGTMFHVLSSQKNLNVFGTARSNINHKYFKQFNANKIINNIDVENQDLIIKAFNYAKPDVIINCVGVIKQLSAASDLLTTLPINSMLPHRLAGLALNSGARLIHYSTDCVFSGKGGNYNEEDQSDCDDLYGRSKLLGEVVDYPNAVTLRTSIIGHELNSNYSLLDWFLSQEDGSSVKGFTKAIFSGLTTYEHAKIIANIVLTNKDLHGLYHVAAEPIDKYSLLQLIAKIYNKRITIKPHDVPVIDRSLDSSKFYEATGYKAPKWENLIEEIYNFKRQEICL
ncbi:MAG: SDR family oxidoreductase [Rickettsiaceae bacterium]|nr:SDR family oxidoreductase [Rickettsiaceae bacterium]